MPTHQQRPAQRAADGAAHVAVAQLLARRARRHHGERADHGGVGRRHAVVEHQERHLGGGAHLHAGGVHRAPAQPLGEQLVAHAVEAAAHTLRRRAHQDLFRQADVARQRRGSGLARRGGRRCHTWKKTGSLTFKSDFNTVLEINRGFKGSLKFTGGGPTRRANSIHHALDDVHEGAERGRGDERQRERRRRDLRQNGVHRALAQAAAALRQQPPQASSKEPPPPKRTTPSLIPVPTVNGNTVRSFLYAPSTVRSERKLDHCLTL